MADLKLTPDALLTAALHQITEDTNAAVKRFESEISERGAAVFREISTSARAAGFLRNPGADGLDDLIRKADFAQVFEFEIRPPVLNFHREPNVPVTGLGLRLGNLHVPLLSDCEYREGQPVAYGHLEVGKKYRALFFLLKRDESEAAK